MLMGDEMAMAEKFNILGIWALTKDREWSVECRMEKVDMKNIQKFGALELTFRNIEQV